MKQQKSYRADSPRGSLKAKRVMGTVSVTASADPEVIQRIQRAAETTNRQRRNDRGVR